MRISTANHLLAVLAVLSGVWTGWLGLPVGAAEINDISGMVALHGNTPAEQHYLIVNDKKDRDRPEDQGPRVGIVTVTDDEGLSYMELDVPAETWGSRPANDLEAACIVPGTDDLYLLLESSYYKDRYGRIFMVRLTENDTAYHLEVLRTYQLPRKEQGFSLEGIACFFWQNELCVLLGDRGNLAADRDGDGQPRRGLLMFAKLPTRQDELEWRILAPLVAPWFAGLRDEGYRHCCDMYMQPLPDDPGQYRLWVAAGYDPDNKTGPFRSEVYAAGIVDTDAETAEDLFLPLVGSRTGWRSDTVKIEALAISLTSPSGLCTGTDDEALGGIWRNLGPAMLPQDRAPY